MKHATRHEARTRAAKLFELFSSFGVFVLALGLIWGSITVHLVQERHQILRHSLDEAGNLSRGFEENVTSAFMAVDQALVFMRAVHRLQRDSFDLASWARSSAFLNSQTVQMSLADRDGLVLQSNLGRSTSPISIADRVHFLVQRDANSDQLFISRPVLGRVSKRLTLNVTRRLLAADGTFDGVVVVSFAPEYLSGFYESLRIGSGRLTIVGTDGLIRARAPDMPQRDGATKLEPYLLALTSQPADLQLKVAAEDQERVVAVRHLRGFPLVVIVELPLGEALTSYLRDRRDVVLVGAAVSLMVTAIWLLLLQQRRRSLRSRRTLSLALESITQGLMMVSPDRRIAVINDRAVELLELPSFLIEKDASFDEVCAWQDQQGEFGDERSDSPDRAMFVRARRFEAGSQSYERLRANGTALEIRTALLSDGSAVRTFTDVTDRRRNEEAMRASRDAAEAGSRARTEFLAVMSHEIRTPLNGILGVSALLAERPFTGEDAEHIRIIQQSGEHLLALVNDILDFSKLDAERMELERTPFALVQSLHAVVALLHPQAERQGLSFTLQIAPGVPEWVEGDAARLGQILLNLLGNALKFTATGGVELRVRRDGASGKDRLRFEVEDTGMGIPLHSRQKLFKVFTQVDQTISRRFGGTGLGLAICQRIVGMMGGEIVVESEPERGSLFWFSVVLPARPAQAAAPLPEVTDLRLRILLAEDNDVNRLVATRLLTRRGHSVDAVVDGVQALRALQAQSYDLLLTDVMMPEMDGIALTRQLRALPAPLGHLPVIGLTAKTGEADMQECIAAGMDGYVAKPIVPERLERMIASVMGRAAIRSMASQARDARRDDVDTSEVPRFDPRQLADLAAAIGEHGVLEVVDVFRSGVGSTIATLRRLGETADATGLMREVHALASAACSVGLEQVGSAARTLELSLAAGRGLRLSEVEEIVSLLLRDVVHLPQSDAVTTA